ARGNVGFDRFDHAVTDADVAPAAQRLARIEYVSAFDHEIELVVRRHGGARRATQGERERTGGDEKIAARRARPSFLLWRCWRVRGYVPPFLGDDRSYAAYSARSRCKRSHDPPPGAPWVLT